MRRSFFESRKGISIMVSYILLVVFLIIIGGIVYQWLKTYIPRQSLKCPDGTSLFIKEADFDPVSSQLTVALKNNGRFNLAGYFIYATNNSDQELPTIDLSGYLDEAGGSGIILGNSVLFFEGGSNLFSPGSEDTHLFDIPSSIGELYFIRIIPTRFQEVEGKSRFVSCGNARVDQIIGEPYSCVLDTCASLGYNCGIWNDGCGGTLNCGTCTSPNVCDSSGQCVALGDCTDTCQTYGYNCGSWIICGDITDCGTCSEGFSCNATGQCESIAGNNVCDPGETCADSDCEGFQNGCLENYVCQSGICVLEIPGTITNCADYCIFLGNYAGGNCRQNDAQCTVNGEIWESGGDPYCAVGVTDNCCCIPM